MHPDISGPHKKMVKLYQHTMWCAFLSPGEMGELEIRPLSKKDQDAINISTARTMLGDI